MESILNDRFQRDMYLEPCQRAMMEVFCKKIDMAKWLKPVTIFAKNLRHRCLTGF